MERTQREYYLNEQMKAIQKELGDGEEGEGEIAELEEKIAKTKLSKEALEKVTIDVSHAHIWDISSVSALDKVVLKFRREGAEVEIIGLNRASETIVDRLAIHDKPGALDRLMGH
ncbi:MAG: STAS domain-containing protein, partial [Rhodospirillaceae bacterium]